uniref:Uncharacterized protein n=1 Tax=Tanacetum cinerariifolium TaxID=118510 RepID=A0A699TIZ1_TANCI|nr:hypothetical protein [Tanacetum cinerariifolium]
MLHELRASLSIRLANRVILPLQMLMLSSREKLIRRSRTGTELLANLCANLEKQCLQGVLNGRRKVGVGTYVNHLT